MFTCICNALRESAVRAVAPTCSTPGQVYRALDCRPQCGRCKPSVRAILNECQPAASLDAVATEPSALPDCGMALAAE